MPSALLRNYSSGIPPRVIRKLTGRGSNRPSLRVTPPCATSFVTGRNPYQPTFRRVFLCTSAPPSRRFRSLLAKVSYTPPTTASFCSSLNRFRKPHLTRSAWWDARLVCRVMSLFAFAYPCSCALGPCRPASRQLPATSAPRALCECSNVLTGGMV